MKAGDNIVSNNFTKDCAYEKKRMPVLYTLTLHMFLSKLLIMSLTVRRKEPYFIVLVF